MTGTEYVKDLQNRLISILLPLGNTMLYSKDTIRQRISKSLKPGEAIDHFSMVEGPGTANAAVYVGKTSRPFGLGLALAANGLASPLRLTCGMRIRKCTYFV